MNNGLLAPGVVSFVFAPLVITVALLLFICWKRMKDSRALLPAPLSGLDAPGLLLTSAVRRMPEERREWGTAMMTELSQIHDRAGRWRFALGCVRVALFPPRCGELPMHALTSPSPASGVLAVALPPLGYYSVPHSLVTRQVDVRITGVTIECFHQNQRVASHVRSDRHGQRTAGT